MGQDHHDRQLRDGQAARLGGARSGTAGRDQSVWRDRRCSSRGPENAERPCGALRFKVALTRKLYGQGLSRDDLITLYKFLDWGMTLPEDLKIQYNQSIDEIEKERNVQILTSIEERGWKKGIQQGMQASQAEVWR